MKINELPVEIIHINYHDEHEGTVKFRTESGNTYEAFLWGNTFEVGEKRKIELSHLNLHFDWEVTFSLNSSKEKRLEKLTKDWGYIGYGQIEQVNPVIACFGDIWLDLGNWTRDEKVIGEFIYWRIERLEVI
ncbi:hypothetical protein [uncultured Pontibacter sp.]|uniref:hypothetical protein n=1 Tax=uncultured Pontibacter sp. TaxID=453356 RepID=UPI00261C5E4E|nr:hypothetical protein [uncultured Pontibacter sp.]